MTNNETEELDLNGIAIIGLAGRFPGAADIQQFWENLKNGVESITFFTDEELLAAGVSTEQIQNPAYVKACAALADIELFDADFFNIGAKDAAIMDPQQRLFLECSWAALEDAGYVPDSYPGLIGIYGGGSGDNTYYHHHIIPNMALRELLGDFQLNLANDRDFLTTRVSYKLNLKGPSLNVQTACSTSLVAISLACQSLYSYQCDIALAGGSSIKLPQDSGYLYKEGMIFSADGHCRAYDAKASGTLNANGIGLVVLKRLEEAINDRDQIYAVIKSVAINNDGSNKIGYTAPSVEGQTEVIASALAIANLNPEDISYIEGHGTGTALGDPIEFAALLQAFQTDSNNRNYCALGSVKTNIGHCDAAAGIAGTIKAVLALKHKIIPPTLHFTEPNPKINLTESPFYINTSAIDWQTDSKSRYAGVSSFGFGGTNAHAIFAEAPQQISMISPRPWQLLCLSAKTPAALTRMSAKLQHWLVQHPAINLADAAYTLSIGRKRFENCNFAILPTQSVTTEIEFIKPITANPVEEIIFVFPGQGSQYVNMAKELYENEPYFKATIDQCASILQPLLNLDLRDIIFPKTGNEAAATEQLKQTAVTQPAIFVIEYALAELLLSWGITPNALIGHSLGEYVAACVAEVFSLEDALLLIAKRGQLIQQLPGGAMLSIPLTANEVTPHLSAEISLAAINGSNLCVVAGTKSAIENLNQQLQAQNIECRYLQTSHAFHSFMLDDILPSFAKVIASIKLSTPKIPFLSNFTGTWITDSQATDPQYWVQHLRNPVQFDSNLKTILQPATVEKLLLEIGPGQTLTTLAKRHPARTESHNFITTLPHPQDPTSSMKFLWQTLGQLWAAGIKIDWTKFYGDEARYRISMPTYSFERKRYWIDRIIATDAPKAQNFTFNFEPVTSSSDSDGANITTKITARDNLEHQIATIWMALLGNNNIGIQDNYFDLGGDSLLAVQLIQTLNKELNVKLTVSDILSCPTIETFTQRVRDIKPAAEAEPLVLLKAGANNSPLFIIHPIGGNVLCYYQLSQLLNTTQPIYGIQQTQGFTANEKITIEELALEYINAIKRIQPQGPYYLCGWSFGGLIAHEMAYHLEQQDEKIAYLGLIDCLATVDATVANQLSNKELIELFLVMLGGHLGIMLELNNDQLSDDNIEPLLENALAIAKQTKLIHAGADINDLKQLFFLFKNNLIAADDYKPKTINNSLTLFAANEILNDNPLLGNTSDANLATNWRPYVKGEIIFHTITGNHFTMLRPAGVYELAKLLNNIFN